MEFQKRWTDAYREVNLQKSGETCCVDDLTAGPDELLDVRIDYIFIAPGDSQAYQLAGVKRVLHQPSRLEDGWLWTSDHVGLLADIKIQR
jgi:exonuclease III